jgi:hypothetical protein
VYAALLAVAAGCAKGGDQEPEQRGPDGGRLDAAPERDAAQPDAGDGGSPDSGTDADARIPADGGSPEDAGEVEPDAGEPPGDGGQPPGDGGVPDGGSCGVEVCDGLDNNCDGTADETFSCVQGTEESCEVSACSGTRTCNGQCEWTTCDLGPAPDNDTCEGTVPTLSASGTYEFETCGATDDYGASCGAGAGSPDVVYRLQLDQRSEVELEVTDAMHDTVLHLYSGDSCPGDDERACNDDGAGLDAHARIVTVLDPGTWWLVVDGYDTDNLGAGTLSASIAPPHDDCGGAEPLDLDSGRTVVQGSTTQATDSLPSCGNSGDVWYEFELDRREMVFVHTYGSGFDTRLGMRDGSCGASTTPCADDSCSTAQSELVRNLDAGTYYLVVDGHNGSDGEFTLTLEHLPLGNTGQATEITPAGMTSWEGTTSGTGIRSASCAPDGGAPEQVMYWTHCPQHPGGTFSANTCDFDTDYDTVIYLRSGETGETLACNDDSSGPDCGFESTIETDLPSGAGLFLYYLDGYDGASGHVVTDVNRPE